MEELVKLVSQKTGLPEAQAKVAVDTVLGYLKQRLPPQLGTQLDAVAAGKQPDLKSLGGMLGL